MYLKLSVHVLMELFSAVPKLPDFVYFALFLHIYIFNFKNINRTLFERGNVLKLSSYWPNNKKKLSNLWWKGVHLT